MMRRGLVSVAGALVLLWAMLGTAHAAGPSRTTFVDEGAFEIDCGTFTLHETYQDKITVLEWLDSSGGFVKAQVHHAFSGTIQGPGGILRLSDPGHWTDFIDGDGVRQVGLLYRLIVPGVGLVAHDAGVIGFDAETGEVTIIRGPHDVFVEGLEALICPLFR